MTRKEKLIWLSAFFDGEGCISIITSAHKYYYLRLSICNTNKETIDLFRNYFGGKLYVERVGKRRNKDLWSCHLNTKESFEALRKMTPYLISKKEQGIFGLKFWENRIQNGPNVIADKESYLKMRSLKHSIIV